jgi:hypothetical protein
MIAFYLFHCFIVCFCIGTFGALVVGPVFHKWFGLLDKIIPGQGMKSTLKKLFVDQSKTSNNNKTNLKLEQLKKNVAQCLYHIDIYVFVLFVVDICVVVMAPIFAGVFFTVMGTMVTKQ